MPINGPQPSLSSIPPEVRAIIYEHILVSEQPINLFTCLPFGRNIASTSELLQTFHALSLTCEQTRHEAESVFFVHNTFMFLANRQLPLIPDPSMRQMRRITLYRMLVGKEFRLNVHKPRNGSFETSVEVVQSLKDDVKVDYSPTMAVIVDQIVETLFRRLIEGAKVAAKMLEKVRNEGNGVGMRDLEMVAGKLNSQWLIAI